jgi:hypothetical protein
MAGKTKTVESGKDVSILLDADEPAVVIGGAANGHLRIQDSKNRTAVAIETLNIRLGVPDWDRKDDAGGGGYGSITMYDNAGKSSVQLSAVEGRLRLRNGDERKIELDSRTSLLVLGKRLSNDTVPILIKGDEALVKVGGGGVAGRVVVSDGELHESIILDGATGAVTIGIKGREGDLIVKDQDGREVFRLDGKTASIVLGANGRSGDVVIVDAAGRNVCHIDGNSAAIRLGASGSAGDVIVKDAAARDTVRLNGADALVTVGTNGRAGRINVRRADGTDSVQIAGDTGDILLANADCAEEFDFADAVVPPGSVVVIDDDERLTLSKVAYDTRVAGVISGAGRYRPAIVLDRQRGAAPRPAVSMIGKVECLVDATQGSVRCGDLLVSSPTPGHAMAARDRERTAGAVIGKALRPMTGGQGLIPILVCLQ